MGHTLLSLSCDLRGVHALFSTHNQLRYVQFSLETGRFYLNSHFSELSSKYLIKQGSALRLAPVNQGVGLIIDKHGSLFPISKNTIGNVRDLELLVGSLAGWLAGIIWSDHDPVFSIFRISLL